MYCCVTGCGVVSQHGVTLFQLPIGPTLRRKWLSAINPQQRLTIDSAVCTKHFAEADLVYIRGKIRLRPKVVPSLFGVHENLNPPKPEEEIKENDFNDNNEDKSDSERKSDESDSEEPIINAKNRKLLKNKVKRKRKSVRNKSRKKTRNNESDTSSDEGDDDKFDANGDKDSKSDKFDANGDKDSKSDKFDANGDKDSKSDKCDENGDKNQISKDKNSEQSDTEEASGDDDVEQPNVAQEKNNSEYDILVTPSIEFYCNEDEPNPETEVESEPAKHDIEDILTNYQIKQNNIHSRLDPEDVLQTNIVRNDNMQEIRKRVLLHQTYKENTTETTPTNEEVTNTKEIISTNQEKEISTNQNRDNSKEATNQSRDKTSYLEKAKAKRVIVERRNVPVFISVTSGTQEISSSSEEESCSRDCVMLLEKVQVEVDPAALLQQYTDNVGPKNTAPISLLTSSDESDVILQEPHIDTVEVSDETDEDEDEVPLVKLLPQDKKKSEPVGWEKSYGLYCYECNYTAKTRKEIHEHKKEHTKVLQVCDICQYTTASKFQFLRHRRKHKEEKRFKCNMCSFRAKHHMSLIYHLKRHNIHQAVVEKLNCDNCDVYETNNSKWLRRHKKHCESEKKFECEHCDYATKRATDLRRHMTRKHGKSSDDEYMPTNR